MRSFGFSCVLVGIVFLSFFLFPFLLLPFRDPFVYSLYTGTAPGRSSLMNIFAFIHQKKNIYIYIFYVKQNLVLTNSKLKHQYEGASFVPIGFPPSLLSITQIHAKLTQPK